MKKHLPELLSPAGDLERLRYAVAYGADAVYLGGREFGMRASPKNFGPEELGQAVSYAHSRGIKVYLVCNILPRNDSLARLPDFLRGAAQAGVDALIVADIGVMMAAKRYAPDVDLHISTQLGVVNYLTASELWRMGAKRVVLARELSLEEIREIRENTPPELELEAFVHGAMCVSVSGRCLISQYMVNRDANQGDCAQPCRWKYRILEESRPGQYFPIEEDSSGTYLYNAHDMCMIGHIRELAEAGISSFKIEGRAKSFYYVAVVTNAYRTALDRYGEGERLPQWAAEEVNLVSHRPYSTGFYFGSPGQCLENGGYLRSCDICATVDGWEQGELLCTQRNRFSKGEILELLSPGQAPVPFPVTEIRLDTGEQTDCANHPMERLRIPCSSPYPLFSLLRRRCQSE